MQSITFYAASGSPYAWRVWLTLEHKNLSYDLKLLSFDAGDLARPEFRALNPRKLVPVIVDGDFTLYESAAIVEYLEDAYPDAARVFSTNLRERSLQRRLVREVDQYFAEPMERLVVQLLRTPKEQQSDRVIDGAWADLQSQLGFWEDQLRTDYLTGQVSAADYTLFPQLALALRIVQRRPGLVTSDPLGPRLRAWKARMEALPVVQKTWPPHWK
jgi:glutathione S-transferase